MLTSVLAGIPVRYAYRKINAAATPEIISINGVEIALARTIRIRWLKNFRHNSRKSAASRSSIPNAFITRIPISASCITDTSDAWCSCIGRAARRILRPYTVIGTRHSGNNTSVNSVNFQSNHNMPATTPTSVHGCFTRSPTTTVIEFCSAPTSFVAREINSPVFVSVK